MASGDLTGSEGGLRYGWVPFTLSYHPADTMSIFVENT